MEDMDMNQRQNILKRCFDLGVRPWVMGKNLYVGSPQLRIPIIKMLNNEVEQYANWKKEREAEEANNQGS
ncbi:MAG: hypothetical protein HRT49_18765 [Cognatishimia sp.]|nr:hypothetical protein [Cognatishimia sp.]